MTPTNPAAAEPRDGRLTILFGHGVRCCPECGWEMLRDGRSGVEIERCPLCYGIWLDKDELDLIIARTSDEHKAHLEKRV